MKPATVRSKAPLAVVATADAVHVQRWPWCQLVGSELGPPPITRLVLHTIALYLNADGTGCWASQSAIAKRAGLGLRSVKRHIAFAKRTRWLEVTAHHYTGQAWRRNSYSATVPATLFPAILELQGGATQAPRAGERGATLTPRWGHTGPEVGPQWPINLSASLPVNMSEGQGASVAPTAAPKSAAPNRSKDDLKNRSQKNADALRAQIAAASRPRPAQRIEVSDAELAEKVRKLRAANLGAGDIRRALASQASDARLTRVLKSKRR